MDEYRRARVALNRVLAEDLRAQSKLKSVFPDPRRALEVGEADLIRAGLTEAQARQIGSPRLPAEAEKELHRIEKRGWTLLIWEDDAYPELLRETFDPPAVLYCAGRVDALNRPSVALVGARRLTPYGRAVSERLAKDLAASGLVIVSGMARGVDTAAHWGALNAGATIAVMGSGLDVVYPKENAKLFKAVQANGVVVTEYPLGTRPLGFHFPLRNRIISGLSLATVVIEASERSGSLITARLALEQNREVLAVPGNITSRLSLGTNRLIKAGAKPVESWKDVVEELPETVRATLRTPEAPSGTKPEKLGPNEDRMMSLLRPDALTQVDDLVERSRLSVAEVLTALLNLEIQGQVIQNPGKFYQRKV